ncbi:MAG TPA: SIMPL domain-containing protein [Candidatus Binatia bacterium]|nr:SIMPL domain-containing protein [Candidatus Binatia bacterium]
MKGDPSRGPIDRRCSAAASAAAAIGAAALLLAGAASARADEHAPRQPAVVVGGEAEVRAAPDRAFVTIATESRDRDPKAAQKQNAVVMNAVQEKLRATGIPPEAVRTLAYQLELEFDWDKGKRTPRGYLARNAVEVRLDDVARVGEVIDLAVAAGANDVTGIRFDLKDRAALEREALRRAVADARARADAAAAGAGVTIDAVQRIEEQSESHPMPRPMAFAKAADAAEAAPPTSISAGEIAITSRVTLTATIRPGPPQPPPPP